MAPLLLALIAATPSSDPITFLGWSIDGHTLFYEER
jgi:hypothetical protein